MAGSLRYQKGGWRLRVSAGTGPDGRRIVHYRTVHEPNTKDGRRRADVALSAFVVEVEHMRGQARSSLTVGEWVESWMTRRCRPGDWAPSTRNTNRPVIRRHILATSIAGRRLAELRRRDVAGWIEELVVGGRGPSTIDHARRLLHRALVEAVDLEVIPANPAAGVRGPAVPDPGVDAPSDAELDRIIASIDDPQLLTIALVEASLGARRGEVCALRWTDLDLDAATISVARAISDGGSDGGLVERQTKTGKKRVVAVDAATVAELRAHRARRAEQCLAVGVPMDPAGFVFTTPRDPSGAQCVRPEWITRRFNAARKKAGASDTITFGSLRHYVATMLLADGIDVNNAARRLGHRPETLLANYAHAVPEVDREAAERLAARRRRTS